MGGRGLGGLLAVSVLGGCSIYFGDSPDAGPADGGHGGPEYAATLDVDVVVQPRQGSDWITVYLTEADRSCTCSGGSLPRSPGSCSSAGSDECYCTCDPFPAACLRELSIQRSGEIADLLANDNCDPSVRGAAIPGTGSTAVLHLSGCGAETDLPVPVRPSPPPLLLTDLHGVLNSLHVSWANGPPPVEALIGCSTGFVARNCRESDGQADFDSAYCGYLFAHALTGGVPVETDSGEIRVWQAGPSYNADLMYPSEVSPGRWQIAGYGWRVNVQVASDMQTFEVTAATISAPDQPVDTTLDFTAGPFHYTAGPTEDALEWNRNGRRCTATVPHPVPAERLIPGDPYWTGPFELAQPITTLACNTGGPLELGFDLSWDLWVVVRPE